MKDAAESSHRKLIRPSLSDVRERNNHKAGKQARVKRAAPSSQTHAEAFYYVKQMQNRTPMTIVLHDGEILSGVIEWYDETCLKITREDGPNLLIYKSSVKYLHKAEK
jgi:host factor-I protein